MTTDLSALDVPTRVLEQQIRDLIARQDAQRAADQPDTTTPAEEAQS